MTDFNCNIGNKYRKDGREVFQWKKLSKIFYLFDGVEWIKSIKEIVDLRKLIIYALIILGIFAYGYVKGHQNTPVKIDIGYDKEAIIELTPDSQLHIMKDGTVWLEDREGNKLKQISVKDIPNLKRQLSPIGFELKPIAVLGYGVSDFGEAGAEFGAGVSFFRFWQGELDAFLTNKGVYGGLAYKLGQLGLENSAIGIGLGKGWEGDNRGIIYFRMKF